MFYVKPNSTQTGVYSYQCTVFCGAGHGSMKGDINVTQSTTNLTTTTTDLTTTTTDTVTTTDLTTTTTDVTTTTTEFTNLNAPISQNTTNSFFPLILAITFLVIVKKIRNLSVFQQRKRQ